MTHAPNVVHGGGGCEHKYIYICIYIYVYIYIYTYPFCWGLAEGSALAEVQVLGNRLQRTAQPLLLGVASRSLGRWIWRGSQNCSEPQVLLKLPIFPTSSDFFLVGVMFRREACFGSSKVGAEIRRTALNYASDYLGDPALRAK